MRRLGGGYHPLSRTRGAKARLCWRLVVVVVALMGAGQGWAEEGDDLAGKIRNFVVTQFHPVKGKLEIQVGTPTLGGWPAVCAEPLLNLPQGNRLGRLLVAVQCGPVEAGVGGWRGLVPVQVSLMTPYFVTRRALTRETVLSADDLEERSGKVTYLDSLTRLSDGVGKALSQPLAAGQVLRISGLHEVFLVHRGQSVALQIQGEGFQISTDGVALGDAAEGQNVQVRTTAGKLLSGKVTGNAVVQIVP